MHWKTPYHIILPALLEALSHLPDRNIVFFCATGTHRPSTNQELQTILGDKVVQRFRIVQNTASEPSQQQYVGTTSSGNRVLLNRDKEITGVFAGDLREAHRKGCAFVKENAMVQTKADVFFHSGLDDETVKNAHLKPVKDINTLILSLIEKYGPDTRICVLPEGPHTIPYLEN